MLSSYNVHVSRNSILLLMFINFFFFMWKFLAGGPYKHRWPMGPHLPGPALNNELNQGHDASPGLVTSDASRKWFGSSRCPLKGDPFGGSGKQNRYAPRTQNFVQTRARWYGAQMSREEACNASRDKVETKTWQRLFIPCITVKI